MQVKANGEVFLRPRALVATIAAGLILASLLLAAGCMKVPFTGRQHLILVPMETEIALGEQAYTEILKDEEIIAEGSLADAVSRVGARIARKTPQPFRALDWEFKLVASEMANAFALPGGKIAVYKGMIPVLKNEAGLAAVLAHEVGHAIARHGAERMSGSMLLELGLIAADISLSTHEHRNEIMGLLGLGATVGVVLPFSRANELEADFLGGLLMARAGFDPRESVAIWERMTEMHGAGGPEFLSTHPSHGTRIEQLKEDMPTFLKQYQRAGKRRGLGADLLQAP